MKLVLNEVYGMSAVQSQLLDTDAIAAFNAVDPTVQIQWCKIAFRYQLAADSWDKLSPAKARLDKANCEVLGRIKALANQHGK